jgi:hypothetical protein
MCICIHTQARTNTPEYIHTYIHTSLGIEFRGFSSNVKSSRSLHKPNIHVYAYTHKYSTIHTYIHTYTLLSTSSQVGSPLLKRKIIQILTQTKYSYAYEYTLKPSRIHTHIHTYIHTSLGIESSGFSSNVKSSRSLHKPTPVGNILSSLLITSTCLQHPTHLCMYIYIYIYIYTNTQQYIHTYIYTYTPLSESNQAGSLQT